MLLRLAFMLIFSLFGDRVWDDVPEMLDILGRDLFLRLDFLADLLFSS